MNSPRTRENGFESLGINYQVVAATPQKAKETNSPHDLPVEKTIPFHLT